MKLVSNPCDGKPVRIRCVILHLEASKSSQFAPGSIRVWKVLWIDIFKYIYIYIYIYIFFSLSLSPFTYIYIYIHLFTHIYIYKSGFPMFSSVWSHVWLSGVFSAAFNYPWNLWLDRVWPDALSIFSITTQEYRICSHG